MNLRRAQLEDIPAVMAVIRRVVPLMRAAGNLQWDDAYPSTAVFLRDIELRQLWVADIRISEDVDEDAGIIGGFLMLCSYMWNLFSRVERTIPEELMALRRREQIARLRAIVHRRIPIASSSNRVG